MILWLVGMMGSGKSAVGEALAARLDVEYHDSDAEIVSGLGRSIADVWASEGESHFRALERAMIEHLARLEKAVVSTGGGAVLDPANRATMRASGKVVWLRADPETLGGRIGSGGARPLLDDGEDPLSRLRAILEDRRPVYEATADLIVDVDALAIEDVAQELEKAWRS